MGKTNQCSRGEQNMGTRREDEILVLTEYSEMEAFKPLIKFLTPAILTFFLFIQMGNRQEKGKSQ